MRFDFSEKIIDEVTLKDSERIKVVVTKKKMKNLRMTFKNSNLQVSAPKYASNHMINDFISSNINWVEKAVKKAKISDLRPNFMTITELEELILDLTDRWSRIIGVEVKKVRFREMSTRWGVCNSQTSVLTFNKKLMNFPPDCAEYVVVHELCHLLVRPSRGEGPHCKRFWDAVSGFLPNYSSLRKLLKN